ncbi:uncharacterized protein BX664DRAFT_274874 [Halteromyces radiatus]|uniref:uncharacterized protein n=1 Tax=Halteromyces radiatus TaxID=101107 RepID=UPI00221F5775|nr:uncharacterized protein BX664DRAFT_274874 [Halteromyces radiatus]KAI8096678.1 hypothetical protein BX664DRAFT_274874 [Halteromyces radiatus]
MTFTLSTIRRVAVIGAGPGGLIAAKQLKEEGVFDKITVFERNDQVGGTWIYSSETNNNPPLPSVNALQVDPPVLDNNKVPKFCPLKSAVYAGLHTNLPTSVMKYRDFDFDANVPLFPSHGHVLHYLQQFTQAHDLQPLIQFNTSVVKADYDDKLNEWTLTLQTKQDGLYTDTFDAVIVATGHYAIPYIPDFDGIDSLDINGISWMHSRDYRLPDTFKDKTVLVIGSGSSGLDIVRETSQVAKKVYHCVRSDNKQSIQAHAQDASNVERVGLVNRILKDGRIECNSQNTTTSSLSVLSVDHIVFATGYLYSFPFFPFEQDNLIKDGQSVDHLHEYLFYIKNPTLAFLGLPIRIVPMPLLQTQAVLVARCWNPHSSVSVPSQHVMQTTYDQLYGDGTIHRSFVMNTQTEFAYVDRLAAWAEGYPPSLSTDHLLHWHANSTDPITRPLSEEWKQLRIDALVLRKQYLGY